MTTADRLGAAQFVLLTTYRRDGSAVPTPVWVVPVPEGLGVWTARDTGKVKRIRRDGTVAVAECDRRGAPLGPDVAGRAVVLDEEGTARVRAAIVRKYGLIARVLLAVGRLRGGARTPVGLAITVG